MEQAIPQNPTSNPIEDAALVANWIKYPINRWKLTTAATLVGSIITILLMNGQFFLVKLLGLKIPKILPDMPWWELLILGIIDFLLLIGLLIFLSPALIILSIGCTLPVLNWFAC